MSNNSPLDGLKAEPLAEAAVRALAEQTADIAAERAAERTAAKVVEILLLHLGIDGRDPDQLEKLRDDLNFLRRLNRGSKEVKSAAIKTCVGALFTGLLALIGIGLKDWIWK